MNKLEVAQLLTYISMIDNRTVAPETVEAWHDVLGYLDYDIAKMSAVEHRRTTNEYLMPAHITRLATHFLQVRAGERRRAISAGMIPKDYPEGKAINPQIVGAATEWLWDREFPEYRDIERYNVVADKHQSDGNYEQWEKDRKPWRKASGMVYDANEGMASWRALTA